MKSLKFWEAVTLLLLLMAARNVGLSVMTTFILIIMIIFSFDELIELNKERNKHYDRKRTIRSLQR